jgi:thiol-disulfide isomerase/thioredoxin
MRTFIGLIFLFASTAHAAPPTRHYCNLGVFTPAELARHQELAHKLAAGVLEHRELDAGYAFRFSGQLKEVGELIDGTRRCCPTLSYRLEFAPEAGEAVLAVTGAGAAKEFIREEFKILFTSAAVRDPAALDQMLARAGDRPVMLEIGADWCAACRVVAEGALKDPRVAAMGFTTVHVDVTDDDRLAKRYRVDALPTFIFLRGGVELSRQVGTVSADELLAAMRAAQDTRAYTSLRAP